MLALICRHCTKSKVNRPRRLCWSCYYAPGVRDLYPPTSKYARRGVGNFAGHAPLPVPTHVPSGTPEKLAVMRRRAQAREQIFHPADARFWGDPRPVEYARHSAGLHVVRVSMTDVGQLPDDPAVVRPACVVREFVVGTNPHAPGLPDLVELKERVAEWKRSNPVTAEGDLPVTDTDEPAITPNVAAALVALRGCTLEELRAIEMTHFRRVKLEIAARPGAGLRAVRSLDDEDDDAIDPDEPTPLEEDCDEDALVRWVTEEGGRGG